MRRFLRVAMVGTAMMAGAEARAADLAIGYGARSAPDTQLAHATLYRAPRPLRSRSTPCEVDEVPLSATTAQPLTVLYNMPASCLGFPVPGTVLMRLPRGPSPVSHAADTIRY